MGIYSKQEVFCVNCGTKLLIEIANWPYKYTCGKECFGGFKAKETNSILGLNIDPPKVGDRYKFVYPDEPEFNCDLVIERITGEEPNDLIFWSDGTHTKQKYMWDVQKFKVKHG